MFSVGVEEIDLACERNYLSLDTERFDKKKCRPEYLLKSFNYLNSTSFRVFLQTNKNQINNISPSRNKIITKVIQIHTNTCKFLITTCCYHTEKLI